MKKVTKHKFEIAIFVAPFSQVGVGLKARPAVLAGPDRARTPDSDPSVGGTNPKSLCWPQQSFRFTLT